MINIIVEISKYVLLFFMILFTWDVYRALSAKDRQTRTKRLRIQLVWMILFNFVAYLVMYLQTMDFMMILMYGGVVLYIILTQVLFHLLYKRASFVLLNVMCMLFSVGQIIQSRLGMETATKQLVIASAATLISLLIPVIIRKMKALQNMGLFFAIAGILLIGAVFAMARVSGGGKLSIEIYGVTFQFSEFVKITFVFFIAGMLKEVTTFRQVFIVTILAGIHVVILVASTDLGAALIYFVAYIVMVCVATRKVWYAFVGLGGMALSSVAAYKMFSHVRVRVNVWLDPFADYQGTGYQIIQALFGVCAGGWFGTGLFNGSPESIPQVKADFTYAAICEEMGILFGICLILLCMGLYLVIVNISMKLSSQFYKLVAIGLGTEYAFQVFLTIGGTTKFIPMTGITLPLISYGGSSIMCTIFMIAIVQGLYVLRKDEGVAEDEEEEFTEQYEPVRPAGGPVPGRPVYRQNAPGQSGYPQNAPGEPGYRQSAPGEPGYRQQPYGPAGAGQPVRQGAPGQPGAGGVRPGQPNPGRLQPGQPQPGRSRPEQTDRQFDTADMERKIEEATEESLNW